MAEEMVVAEIVNPSDKYTIKGTPIILCYAGLFLGEGQYALNTRDGETVLPLMLFGGDPKKFILDEFGEDFDEYLAAHYTDVADCLDSVMIGGFNAREDAEKALEGMNPEEREKWLAERHDKRRSSMNDIGGYARKLAAAFRKKAAENG